MLFTLSLALVAVLGTTFFPSVAGAAGGAWASWAVAGSASNFTGTVGIAATGFPATTFTSNSTTATVASGASAFLGPSTPPGAAFTTSQNQPYITLRTASGNTTSTTVFSFATQTPGSGWGFVIGDIDADQVAISATGANGSPVTVAELGFQSVFNYCTVTPKPSSCGTGPFDTPTWNATTGTLIGNGSDTSGASGWFRPTVPLSTLTLAYSPLSGLPVYQLWFAAATATIAGQVTVPGGASPDATVDLLSPTGTSLATTSTDADGDFSFAGVDQTTFEVEVDPPAGFTAPPPVAVDASAGDVTLSPIALAAIPTTTTTTTVPSTTTTTTTAQPATTATSPPTTSPPASSAPAAAISPGGVTTPTSLAATGADASLLVAGGGGSLLLGGTLVAWSYGPRRRQRRSG